MNRLKIAQYIALGATICTIGGGFLESKGIGFGTALWMFGILAAMVSYCFGGLGKALKMIGTIIKWGWIILPFPINLASTVFTAVLGVMVFLLVPIIPVRMAYKESEEI
jgi:hypothetical protein